MLSGVKSYMKTGTLSKSMLSGISSGGGDGGGVDDGIVYDIVWVGVPQHPPEDGGGAEGGGGSCGQQPAAGTTNMVTTRIPNRLILASRFLTITIPTLI